LLSPAGGNEFIETSYVDEDINCDTSTDTFTYIRDEAGITSSYIDTEDENDNGDTTEIITNVGPVLAGLSSESFNSCE